MFLSVPDDSFSERRACVSSYLEVVTAWWLDVLTSCCLSSATVTKKLSRNSPMTPTRMWSPELNSELNTLTGARNAPTISSAQYSLSQNRICGLKRICFAFAPGTKIFQSIKTIWLLCSWKYKRLWALSSQTWMSQPKKIIEDSVCLGILPGPHSASNSSSEQKC